MAGRGGSLPRPASGRYGRPMSDVQLPPELERFATDAIAAGRYGSMAEIVTAGIRLLQREEERREELLRAVRDAEAEADRDGCYSIEDVEADMRAAVAESARPVAPRV